MREVIAICRSTKRSRTRVARILDQYFWRIGDRTWRGKATNACLDRVSRELRQIATRQTAVSIHEVRSSKESRIPIIRIGNRLAFNAEGRAPIASHPSRAIGAGLNDADLDASKAIVQLAAIFHDLGKATCMFQEKLRRSLGQAKQDIGEADPIRHELVSALVWDELFGELDDGDLIARLKDFKPDKIDEAWSPAASRAARAHRSPNEAIDFRFDRHDSRIASAVGHLVLSHHRLPDSSRGNQTITGSAHVKPERPLPLSSLEIAPGTPFWHEEWCRKAVAQCADRLVPGAAGRVASIDIGLRSALMLGDHLGSARKVKSSVIPDHLANTNDGVAMDSLLRHVQRVHSAAGRAHDMLYRQRSIFPALGTEKLPIDILHPAPGPERFRWQAHAAQAAARLTASGEGGFFACLFAGTGTGKTRGAPTILAAAALNDARPERRYLRFTLGLGLRVLATQSAREYVEDLKFSDKDVSVVIGQAPIEFGKDDEPAEIEGSESLIELPEWLRVEMATGGVPLDGDDGEAEWIRSLSHDTGRHLPAFCEQVLDHAGKRSANGRRLIAPPVMICTIDNLMGVAAPARSRHLLGAIRVMTSDLILDEIDQYGAEDIAAVARLVYQTGAAGGRVIAMSATMTPDIALTLKDAYDKGWSRYALESGMPDRVHFLCTGDSLESCRDTHEGAAPEAVVRSCISEILKHVAASEPLRKTILLDPCESWETLVEQMDACCRDLHSQNHVEIGGFRVSFGLLRLTRISHTAAMAMQLPAGCRDGTMRVKICLHANMPRILRSWIEMRLKVALTRKGAYPDAGLAEYCHDEKLFDRARSQGCRDIEIVLVSSPVVETGNDLDFDWGILDPVSTRSIIQSGGRIRRHRPANGQVNTCIIGRPLVAMQSGAIAMPGVETKNRETLIPTPDLGAFEGRRIRDLLGPRGLAQIDAALMLNDTLEVPLRDAELGYCRAMISTDPDAPTGQYLATLRARMSLAVPKIRKFRRQASTDLVYTLAGEDFDMATWHVDWPPGTRHSRLEPAERLGLAVSDTEVDGIAILGDPLRRSWEDYLARHGAPAPSWMPRLFETRITEYGDPRESSPKPAVFHPFLGLLRGDLDLYLTPFGAGGEPGSASAQTVA